MKNANRTIGLNQTFLACIMASCVSLAGEARADSIFPDFKNDTGVTVYDWHFERIVDPNKVQLISGLTGGRNRAPAPNMPWTPAHTDDGGSLDSKTLDPGGLDKDGKLSVTITWNGGGTLKYKWWWTDGDHKQVGDIHTVPSPASFTPFAAGLVYAARRRREH